MSVWWAIGGPLHYADLFREFLVEMVDIVNGNGALFIFPPRSIYRNAGARTATGVSQKKTSSGPSLPLSLLPAPTRI